MAALTKRGRPKRSPIEEVRTAAWFDAVMAKAVTQTTAELERKFGSIPAGGASDKRPSRWAKYRSGTTSPPTELVHRVDRSYLGGKAVYNHPLWQLAAPGTLSPGELRDLLSQFEDYRPLLCDARAMRSGESLFWLPAHFDYRRVIFKVESGLGSPVQHPSRYLERLAVLCGLIHDAAIRQQQNQHFEAHVALARQGGVALRTPGARSWHGKLEALLMVRWLSTEYQDAELRRRIERYRKVDFGAIHTTRLRGEAASARAKPGAKADQSRDLVKRGRWVIEAVEKTFGTLGA